MIAGTDYRYASAYRSQFDRDVLKEHLDEVKVYDLELALEVVGSARKPDLAYAPRGSKLWKALVFLGRALEHEPEAATCHDMLQAMLTGLRAETAEAALPVEGCP